MHYARLCVATVNADVDAATLDDGMTNFDDCPVFKATIHLHEWVGSSTPPASTKMRKSNTTEADVINIWPVELKEDDRIIVGQDAQERWFFLASEPGGDGRILHFYITTPIDSVTREGDAVVVEPLTSGEELGPIKIYDPLGLWVDLEVDAHGIAIYGGEREDPGQPGSGIMRDVWIIVNAERTIERYRVRLSASIDLIGYQSPVIDWTDRANRGVLPYVFNTPNEDGPTGTNEILNPLGIDAFRGSYIWIRRYWSTTNPYARQYYVCDREVWKARYIQVLIGQITGTEPNRDYAVTVQDWADGNNPTMLTSVQLDYLKEYKRPLPAEVVLLAYNKNVDRYFYVENVEWFANYIFAEWTIPALASPNNCLTLDGQLITVCSRTHFDGFPPGTPIKIKHPGYPIRCDTPITQQGMCRFIREESQDGEYVYVVINTQSAVLGNPQQKKVGVGDMEYMECDTGDTGDTFCNPDGSSGGWGLKQERFDALLFGCEPDPQNPPEKEPLVCIPKKDFLDDLCICEYICTYCEEFVGECEPPPECCCDCLFGEGEVTVVIDTRTSISSVKLDECSWEVTMDDDSTITLTYKCDGVWEIDDGLIYSIPDGDCTGVSQSSPIIINITVDGEICTTGGECCPEMGPDSTILNLDIGFGPAGNLVQLANGVYIGGCTFSVEAEWHEDDTGLPCDTGQGPTVTPTTIYLQWDDTAGEWTVWGVPRSPIHNMGEVVTFAGTCCGFQDCGGGPECKNGPCDSTAGNGGITFDSDCVAPAAAAAAGVADKSKAERPGSMLAKRAPHLVNKSQGCGCGSDDAVKLMNAWGCEKSANEVETLVTELKRGVAKSKVESVRNLSREALKQEILQAIQAEYDRIHGNQ